MPDSRVTGRDEEGEARTGAEQVEAAGATEGADGEEDTEVDELACVDALSVLSGEGWDDCGEVRTTADIARCAAHTLQTASRL